MTMATSSDDDIRKRFDVLVLEWLFEAAFCSVIAFFLIYGELTHSEHFWSDVVVLLILAALSWHKALVVKAIHEGLHVIVAYWLGVPREQIGAKGNQAFTGKVSKSTWVKFTLAPLLFPLFVFILLLLVDWRLAIEASLIIALGSANDLAFLMVALQQPGKFVEDTEAGIFVLEG